MRWHLRRGLNEIRISSWISRRQDSSNAWVGMCARYIQEMARWPVRLGQPEQGTNDHWWAMWVPEADVLKGFAFCSKCGGKPWERSEQSGGMIWPPSGCFVKNRLKWRKMAAENQRGGSCRTRWEVIVSWTRTGFLNLSTFDISGSVILLPRLSCAL